VIQQQAYFVVVIFTGVFSWRLLDNRGYSWGLAKMLSCPFCSPILPAWKQRVTAMPSLLLLADIHNLSK
jgi:hypothetical protein